MTAIRGHIPVSVSPAPQAQEAFARQPSADTPVSAPQRNDAVPQPGSSAAIVTARLAERDESDHPAAEARIAADAARAAYIKASIAAGVNPLPLPGR